jgi:hypothetical protein
LRCTRAAQAVLSGRTVRSLQVRGCFNGSIRARYWVDGSEGGDLLPVLHLPYDLGGRTAEAVHGDGVVMAYAYRWIAEARAPEAASPSGPPAYYEVNKPFYASGAVERWPTYKAAFGVGGSSPSAVNPFRLYNAKGRLTGRANEPSAAGDEPAAGELWQVNGWMNNSDSYMLGKMLATSRDVAQFFADRGLCNPYTPPCRDPRWSDLVWIEDNPALTAEERVFLTGQILEATKAHSLGLLWFIRSGDLEHALQRLPGASSVHVWSDWGLSSQFDTPDRMPPQVYLREGRRVVAEHTISAEDICPTYKEDSLRNDITCRSPPAINKDSVALGDFSIDIQSTDGREPTGLYTSWAHQVDFGALIPRGSCGILVGGAIGSDRAAYSAFRYDPVRMEIGTAMGEAAAMALGQGKLCFQRLSVGALRLRLADDYQNTQYVPHLPDLAPAGDSLARLELARTLQRLLARGCLRAGWTGKADGSISLPDANAAVDGDAVALLNAAASLACQAVVKRFAKPGITIGQLSGLPYRKAATVGDVYLAIDREIEGIRR